MLRVYVSSRTQSFHFDHESGRVVIGRQQVEGVHRVIDDPYISRTQLSLEEVPGPKVQVRNLSPKVAVTVQTGTEGSRIEPGGEVTLGLPARLTVGTSLIEVSSIGNSGEHPLPHESLLTIARPVVGSEMARGSTLLESLDGTPDLPRIIRDIERLVGVQRAAAGSADFYQEIANTVVELIGLEQGMVLLPRGTGWEVAARSGKGVEGRADYSTSVLSQVCREKRTFYSGTTETDPSKSLDGVAMVVASPVLDPSGSTVLGVVYGSRSHRGGPGAGHVRDLHAQFLQVLATAAAAGMARRNKEAEAARLQVQFEQFFPRQLVEELGRNPDLLSGENRVVTILSSDVRDFSKITGRLGPRLTCDLMRDVLERMTARIHEQGGVVVDYAGDGILAMWNAPVPQPDHAPRAAAAAMAMQGELPALDERWERHVGHPLGLGIGIDTGEALVGNTGSSQRMKYGPLGSTVNLASRVEGATKQLGVPALVTKSTRELVSDRFATRRLGRFRLVGMAEPVELFELGVERPTEDWTTRRDAYQNALEAFERGELIEACRALLPLLQRPLAGRYDKPALSLTARAVDGLRTGTFDPIFTFDAK